jgi:hypothetical protein
MRITFLNLRHIQSSLAAMRLPSHGILSVATIPPRNNIRLFSRNPNSNTATLRKTHSRLWRCRSQTYRPPCPDQLRQDLCTLRLCEPGKICDHRLQWRRRVA